MEATHGDRTFGFFWGQEHLQYSARGAAGAGTQTVMGAYFRQKIGSRWLIGARFMHWRQTLWRCKAAQSPVAE